MKNYLRVTLIIVLITSCTTKPSPQYEDGWHKAFIDIDNGNFDGAMVDTKAGLIDTICFSSGKCIGNLTPETTFEHSQDVLVGKDKNNIYTVYIIPDEWDEAKGTT